MTSSKNIIKQDLQRLELIQGDRNVKIKWQKSNEYSMRGRGREEEKKKLRNTEMIKLFYK